MLRSILHSDAVWALGIVALGWTIVVTAAVAIVATIELIALAI